MNGFFSGRWKYVFDWLAEIKFPQSNHFVSSTNCVNKLVRIFIFVSRFVLPMLAHQAGVVNDPIHYHGLGLSDHAPTFWRFAIKSRSHGKAMRLQPPWCRHPAYKRRMNNPCRVAKLEDHPLEQKSVYSEEIRRDAAIHARDCMFQEHPLGKHSKLLGLGSIAKAVWTADHGLHKIMISASDLPSQHLVLNEGDICLRDSAAFEEEFRSAKLEASGERIAEIRNEHPENGGAISEFSASRKLARVSRQKALELPWQPKAPALDIMGVEISAEEAAALGIDPAEASASTSEDGKICFAAPEHFLKAIGHIWGSVFAVRPTDMEITERLIVDCTSSVSWEWNLMLHPNIDMVRLLMSKLKSIAPGMDGICNAAWSHAGDQLAFYIMELLEAFRGNGILPEDRNVGFMAVLDKKPDAQSDGHTPAMVFRHPLDTRPLTLKQADNKQVAKVLNHDISPAIQTWAIDTQRGFIHGGQLVQNVIDLDFQARIFVFFSDRYFLKLIHKNSIGMVIRMPFTLLYDFASAFPGVAHAWLFCVLEAIDIWDAFLTGFTNSYKGNEAYTVFEGLSLPYSFWCLRLSSHPLQPNIQGRNSLSPILCEVDQELIIVFRRQVLTL